MVQSNIMDFSTSSCNAKTQNNAEGLMKKKATHIQRKNNCLNSWIDGDTTRDIDAKKIKLV